MTRPAIDATFDGPDVTPQDAKRLTSQLEAVRELMLSADWLGIEDIKILLWAGYGIRANETSISARLRDLRKARNGGYIVDRRRDSESAGKWDYRVRENVPVQMTLAEIL